MDMYPTGLYRPPQTPPDMLCIHQYPPTPHICTTQMSPWECMCTPHTHAHPAHVYTCLDMPYTCIHHIHTHHIHACLGEPRPHTVYPPTFPMPLTCKPPCAHSPAPFTSLLPLPLATWAQFGLACACTSHGDMNTWPTSVDTQRPHRHLPHIPMLLYIHTHTDSPPGCFPRGCLTVGQLGCYGVLITQTPSPRGHAALGSAMARQSHWHQCEPRAPRWGGTTSVLGVTHRPAAGSFSGIFVPGSAVD